MQNKKPARKVEPPSLSKMLAHQLLNMKGPSGQRAFSAKEAAKLKRGLK